jgi:chemotaxis methyl-accepting protein methylase
MLAVDGPPANDTASAALAGGELAELVRLLALRTGVDLAGLRPAMVARRAAHQIVASGAASAAEYLDLLRCDAAEPTRLLERLTIKVSRLFRNPATYEAIAARVLPELRRTCEGRPLHVWSAGCARGEEVYGLAMLCAASGARWSVLGTDVDRAALARARAATYAAADAADVPAHLAARHLVARPGGAVAIHPALSRHVRFEAHDVAAWPHRGGPFDLVACRNVLIYYLAERQGRIFASLLASLAPGGFLVLGEAEWPPPAALERLAVVDRGCRIFRLAGAPGGSA